MLIRIHRPAAPALAPFVEQFWYCEGYDVPHRKERVIPSGKFQLVIDLSQSATPPLVIGMRSVYSVVDTAQLGCMMGIVFRAGGARSLLDVSADEFYNREIPLDLVIGRTAAIDLRDRLREGATPSERLQILEMSLLDAMRTRAEIKLHPAIRYALREFKNAPYIRSILDVTRDAGLSRRRFAQLFREQIGLTPKLYCRLHRFRDVVQRIGSGGPLDWADVAASGGYCDQAHMAHEFRAFSGFSPSSWLTHHRPFTNHVVID